MTQTLPFAFIPQTGVGMSSTQSGAASSPSSPSSPTTTSPGWTEGGAGWTTPTTTPTTTTTTAGAPTTAGCSSGFGEMGPGLLIKLLNEYLHLFFLF